MKWEMVEDTNTFIYELDDNGENKWYANFYNGHGHKLEAEKAAQMALAAPDMLEALNSAKQFIENGIELGYIKMPDADCPDSAHSTLPKILAAIKKAGGV